MDVHSLLELEVDVDVDVHVVDGSLGLDISGRFSTSVKAPIEPQYAFQVWAL